MSIVRLSILAGCAAVSLIAADLDKIQCVENGLRGPIAIKDQPIVTMKIGERLKFYHVPGVSVAVINGGKIEWARAYGTTSAEGRKPITPDTLFQAASISKHVAAMVALHLVDLGKLSLDEDCFSIRCPFRLLPN